MGISTHILDTTKGRPAADVAVTLERENGGTWTVLGNGKTDSDGRLRTLVPDGQNPEPGTYRISFNTEGYFTRIGTEGFYPSVSIVFRVRVATEHYHVPLLLNPFGFSTYRGS